LVLISILIVIDTPFFDNFNPVMLFLVKQKFYLYIKYQPRTPKTYISHAALKAVVWPAIMVFGAPRQAGL